MQVRDKGFSLVELMTTVAVLAILVVAGIPSFIGIINKAEADNETSELYRSLNYTRLEAINRGVAIRLSPVTSGVWAGPLRVQIGSAPTTDMILRNIPAMSTNATLTMISSAGAASYIEFNNMGSLNNPVAAVTGAYNRGTQSRSLGICLNGRVLLGTTCP